MLLIKEIQQFLPCKSLVSGVKIKEPQVLNELPAQETFGGTRQIFSRTILDTLPNVPVICLAYTVTFLVVLSCLILQTTI